MRPKTIRSKIAWMTGAQSLVVALGFGLFLYSGLRYQLFRSADENLLVWAQQLANAIESQNGELGFERAAISAMRFPTDNTAYLVSSEGVILDGINPEHAPVLAAAGDSGIRFHTTHFSDLEDPEEAEVEVFRFLVFPVQDEGRLLAYLQVGRDMEEVQEALARLLWLLLLTGPVLVGLASLQGHYLAGRALSPMEKIRQQAASIQARDLHLRLDPPTPEDEVGRLAQTFNTLFARLEASFSRQRRFTADASHELRTPLAIIHGAVDVALERPRSPAEYVETLQSVSAEVGRMSRLVDELLVLARADAGELRLELEDIDLADLLHLAVGVMQPKAQAAGVSFQLALPAALPIKGDRDRLLELFFNLLENAIRYAPGSQVTVGGELAGQVARVWVEDSGPGISPEHLPHIFERFYRVDPARNRANHGSGLGLAIAQEIAHLHGGRLSVHSEPGKGTTFVVELS
ncbi:MAG TPA: ATP-binding protein [Anaerolineales bacterium]|nr:ATP-binding protein [Anaerolineales bacterium]HLF74264.1 ATP-binding protein [Anaerolineales bacterium]